MDGIVISGDRGEQEKSRQTGWSRKEMGLVLNLGNLSKVPGGLQVGNLIGSGGVLSVNSI